MEYEIKYWKGKFGCPICGKIETNEEWFVHNHIQETHSTLEMTDCIMTTLYRVAEDKKKPVWVFKELSK